MTKRRLRSAGSILNLEDFAALARRRLPRAFAAYVSGGAGDGLALAAAREAFARWCFVPRVLRGTHDRSSRARILGRDYAMPIGISALGASAVLAYDGDIAMARAAFEAGVPYQLSANSITPLEEVIAVNPHAWFAAYFPAHRPTIDGVLARVARAGFGTLVITVDVPVAALREPETRAGYAMPFRFAPRILTDIALSPRWLFGTALRTFLKRGVPHIANIAATRGPHVFTRDIGQIGGADRFSWEDIRHIRAQWKGRLVLKGILSSEDARQAAREGVDAVIVSSHGGRLSDCMIAPLDALPEIRAACPDLTILLDGGVRRAGDALKAIALGADGVFIGRPFFYAAAVGGEAGIGHALRLLAREMDRELAFLGLLTPLEARDNRLRRRGALGTAP
ncbi:alpha-hydroxy acid oxidase [Acidomonas methanolica]|uniref:L-lactate dehydrogenase n=1 Tax=Acidomonas methanolica NBRC 104435 TaxID=1231351 RepID=A0A023D9V6_ACIMT|nr:alpha-hydroxy acid oxidase [Acidomonas methanolica]MBU2653820.1 alpha-hydroxy-acid oxidizing protein [Acidomonas methanolica]TCS21425.1 L-lactate dehydrogenase (cytochrome) [Acidomonas methanolica]GAJ30490.1 L-lactate dehydrogenase [Acidomonas methanolica NBRC 104435]GBQ48584.1 L-lactate dehydrogenase [Acidomonas methanolica]GEL00547.1 alpha-hydroxy-acid oxidizing enzyme [Acidomonas methanolica NBRC 104435]